MLYEVITAKINSLFNMLKQQGASDLHISSGAPPMFRLHGEMVPLNFPPLSHDHRITSYNVCYTKLLRAG